MNRNLFEEILYELTHKTLPLFISSDRKGGLYRKSYFPVSDNEQLLWNMKASKNNLFESDKIEM